MLSDPWFFAVAIPAVILFGISKSGFGGAFGAISVPIMALAISPVQAAAILLPILCLMDLLGLWAYRGKWVRSELRILLPAALLGIGIGTALFYDPLICRKINDGIRDYLQRHDSATFFRLAGGLLQEGPTGTNVNDFRAILIE